jgi:WhiB family redox-sensing transcriptional regulator
MLLADDILAEMLGDLVGRPAWQADALCREYPEVDFFPGRGESTAPAKAVCARCLVRDECRALAGERNEFGVWGGTSAQERRRNRRHRNTVTTEGANV